VRGFGLIPCVGVFALVCAAAGAQQAEFLVSEHGQQVGTAQATVRGTEGGYETTSVVQVSMQGLEYALSKTEELSAANELKHVDLSATVNGTAVHVIAKPDGAHLLMNTSANGRSTTTQLDAHAAAVMLADFDPGALETLLALAVAHNNRDLWAVLPKQAGSVAAVTLATYADERGMLDGKEIVVHHLVATIGGARTELFSGPGNELLQAELAQDGFALVRKGFVLTPPKRPAARD
jgi:hypothetical protein